MSVRQFLVLSLVLLVSSETAQAKGRWPSASARKAQAAAEKVAKELVLLSKRCRTDRAIDHARRAAQSAVLISPRYKAAHKALRKLTGAKHAPRKGFEQRYVVWVEKASAKIESILQPVADLAAKKGDLPVLWDVLSWLRWHAPQPPSDDDVVYFAPYRRFVAKEHHERLVAGEDWFDGGWHGADEVETANAAHATWGRHWVLSNAYCEVRSTLPIRVTRGLFALATSYFGLVHSRLMDGWDLRPPEGPVVLVATERRKDMLLAYAQRFNRDYDDTGKNPGFYSGAADGVGPCFFTLELNDASAPNPRPPEVLPKILRHEVAHQLCFEGSKHMKHTGPPTDRPWANEGVAAYMEDWELRESGWVSVHRTERPTPRGWSAARHPFGVAETIDDVTPLAELVGLSRGQFMEDAMHNYQQSAALMMFLLETPKTRGKTLEFLALAHCHRATLAQQQEHFGEHYFRDLHDEWVAFLKNIEFADD